MFQHHGLLPQQLKEEKLWAWGKCLYQDCYLLEKMDNNLNFIRETQTLCGLEPPAHSKDAINLVFIMAFRPQWVMRY